MIEQREIPAVVEVKWIDSLVLEHGEWMDRDDLDLTTENMLHSTVGYLIAENEHAICLASSHNDQPHVPINRISGGTVIPKVAIRETNVLRDKEGSLPRDSGDDWPPDSRR